MPGEYANFDLVGSCCNDTPAVNNLGGQGPDEGVDPEMRFSRVGEYNNQPFDLVVRALNNYTTDSAQIYFEKLFLCRSRAKFHQI